INPKLPRELNAVLAVALDSDPRRRYASAELLADDLRRIRQHKPILASPPGRPRRALRWVQRNPRISTVLVGLVALLTLVGNLYLKAEQRGVERLVESMTRVAIENAPARPGFAYAVASEAHRLAPHAQATNDALLRVLLEFRDHRAIGKMPKEAFDWEGAVAAGAEGTQLRVFDTDSWELAFSLEAGAPVARLDLSPDGTRLLVGDDAGRITLWDLGSRRSVSEYTPSDAPITLLVAHWATGRAFSGDSDGRLYLWSLQGSEAPVLLHEYPATVSVHSALSNDGTRLATFSWHADESADAVAHVWDTSNGHLLHSLAGHAAPLRSADFSDDTARLATGSEDGSARVWDLERGETLASLGHPGQVLDVDFGADGQLATACDPGDLAVESGQSAFVWDWQADPRKPRLTLSQSGGRSTYAIAFDPDGDRLATANLNSNVTLWDAASGEQLDHCQLGHFATDLRWGADERELVISSSYQQLVWSLQRRPPCPLVGHDGTVLSARFSPDGSRALTASADGTAKVWDVARTRCLFTLPHGAPVRVAEYSPDGRAVLTGGDDGQARIWSQEGQQMLRLGPHAGGVTHGRFLDAGHVVTASDMGELRLWDLNGTLLRDWTGHTGPIQQIRVGPQGRRVASAGSDRSVRLWSPEQPTPIFVSETWDREKAHRSETRVFDLAFGPDGQSLFSANQDATIRRMGLVQGEIETLVREGPLGGVAWLPDGRPIASEKWRGAVMHWPDGWNRPAIIHRVHTSSIRHLAVASQGFVLTCSSDGTGFLLRLEGQQLVPHMRLTGHDGQLTQGAFSPDGQLVITASLDGTARLWPVHPAQSGLTPRALAPDERALLGLDGGATR
ncbi:MAG: hypothetical protein DRQ55_03120, partial [Planctomycetota bacterium]